MLSPSPQSKRTPEFTTHNNIADCMERALLEDGHCLWGFVIYRCAYDNNDVAWSRLLQALRRYAHETLAYYRRLDMLDRFQLTVVEDEAKLNSASTSVVRDHFREWAAAPDTVARDQGAVEASPGLSQRYNEGGEEGGGDPGEEGDECFVDLIWKDWEPSVPHPRERPMEAIEGCTRPDVGWMRTGIRGVIVEMYEALRDQNAWYGEYRRPMSWYAGEGCGDSRG
ncbi:hypothetical protein F4821DRAFT_280942 [Hypoxylon rubiginosum]|uniref:Uncharacterized protein n=1 Tax=Hypoxylon rubiginosum TaxID=110542 RepID=A0ACC0CSF4_9PEZI|nr:hypothetical protein F4821DRAFT_280942 [Hypoxylon rubiginosum]